MRLILISFCFFVLACNTVRENTDTAHYEQIKSTCYLIRMDADDSDTAVNRAREEMIATLSELQIPVHPITNDSIVFIKQTGKPVEIILAKPKNAAESNIVILFDPAKNPVFVNLRKGPSQLTSYFGNN
jgi:hypothetical protein